MHAASNSDYFDHVSQLIKRLLKAASEDELCVTVDTPACTGKNTVLVLLANGFQCWDLALHKCQLKADAAYAEKRSVGLLFKWTQVVSTEDMHHRQAHLTAVLQAQNLSLPLLPTTCSVPSKKCRDQGSASVDNEANDERVLDVLKSYLSCPICLD